MKNPDAKHPDFGQSLYFEVFFQSVDVCFKSRFPDIGNPADGARFLPGECFLDRDVPRFFELVDLHTQVASGGSGLFAQVDEIGLLKAKQNRHNSQTQFRMQQRI